VNAPVFFYDFGGGTTPPIAHCQDAMDVAVEAGRWLEGYGLANASLDCCVGALTQVPPENAYRLPGGCDKYTLIRSETSAEQALGFLNPFTPPVVRHLLVELSSEWTLCLNNSLPNPTFSHDGPSLAQRSRSRVFRVVDTPSRVWKNGKAKRVMSWEGRIFTEYAANGREEKTILATNDGGTWKWFLTPGLRYPIEEKFNYEAQRIKARFTSDDLRALVASLGAPVPSAELLMASAKFALLQSPGEPDRMVTREELDDPAYGYFHSGLNLLPHIKTHADRVIHDLEMAVEINPQYEPKAREHIEAAKRVLAGEKAA